MSNYFKKHPYLIILFSGIFILFVIVTIYVVDNKPKKHDIKETEDSKLIKHMSFEDIGTMAKEGLVSTMINIYKADFEKFNSKPLTFIDEKLNWSLDTLRISRMKHYKRPLPDSTYSVSDSIDKALSINLSQNQILHVLKLTMDSLKKELIIAKEKMAIDTILNNINNCKQYLSGKSKQHGFSFKTYLKENKILIICFLVGIFAFIIGLTLIRAKKTSNKLK